MALYTFHAVFCDMSGSVDPARLMQQLHSQPVFFGDVL